MKFVVFCCVCLLTTLSSFCQQGNFAGGYETIAINEQNGILYLNGKTNVLIENTLRCFGMGALGNEDDTCVRVFVYEDSYPDSPLIFRMKMLEFGKRDFKEYVNSRNEDKVFRIKNKAFATLYMLEWQIVRDSMLSVKSIKRKSLEPNHGWSFFEKSIKMNRLDKCNLFPDRPASMLSNVSWGAVILQYVLPESTYTLDFTGCSCLVKSKVARERKFVQLLELIEKELSVRMSVSSLNGYDFLSPSACETVTVD